MKKALDGVRVLDLTRILSGPFCTALLADMGAEVIKVEHPLGGDGARVATAATVKGQSMYFMSLNRGKKSITLNLKKEKGVAILKKLVEKADVVTENFRPGVMDRLGVSYEILKKINPRIIFASISGFGKDSPYKHIPAYDLTAQAVGGMMSITGYPDGPPTRAGVSLGDTSTALYAAFAISSALYARNIHGIGQYIDIAMVDSIFSLLEMSLFKFLAGGEVPDRIGSMHPTSYPYDVFKATDGYYVLCDWENAGFKRLCEVMGKTELLSFERFSNDNKRWQNATELKTIIEDWSSNLTVEEVLERFEAGSVAGGPILDIKEIAESEHIKAREMLVEVEHPIAGKIKIPAIPVKFSETPGRVENASPLLGEHTEEILTTLLKYEKKEIQDLKDSEVI